MKSDQGRGDGPAYYRVTLRGVLDPRWADWFDGLTVTSDAEGNTTLAGPVADPAALYGLLSHARDLGLVLLAVARNPPEPG
jgi:hypothetical protein